MLPIWSICTTLGLRGGDFTSNAQAFENKGARISFHPSPARQAGRQADNHNHRYVYTALREAGKYLKSENFRERELRSAEKI